MDGRNSNELVVEETVGLCRHIAVELFLEGGDAF